MLQEIIIYYEVMTFSRNGTILPVIQQSLAKQFKNYVRQISRPVWVLASSLTLLLFVLEACKTFFSPKYICKTGVFVLINLYNLICYI